MLKHVTNAIHYMPNDHRTDRPLLGLVRGKYKTLMVDAGTSPRHAREFLQGVAALGVRAIDTVALTHWHWDHVFGLDAVNAETIAQQQTKDLVDALRRRRWDDKGIEEQVKTQHLSRFAADCLLQEMPEEAERTIRPIDLTFGERTEIDLGGITCVAEHLGGSHTPDSTVYFIPEEKVLFLGDCLYGTFFENGIYGYRLDTLRPMVERIKGFEAGIYLDAHADVFTRPELETYLDRLVSIGEIVGNETHLDRCAAIFEAETGQPVDEETRFTLQCFTDVNRILAER